MGRVRRGAKAVYWSHFGLDRQPFRAAVDPESYFPAPAHEEAIASLAAAVARREAVVLIHGPMGVGKSLVARRWLGKMPAETPRVFVPNAHAERPAALLQAILFDMGKPYQGLTEQELRLTVTGSLLDIAAETGGPTVLVLDEAQHLSQAALEELRMLGNLETRGGGAVFAVLVAQPTLHEALNRPAYELFAQRVGAQAAIVSLTPGESADYVRHQLRIAGGDPEKLVDGGALALIAGACGGIPRLLNRASALAFELAASAEAEHVDVEAVLESLERLGLNPGETEDAEAVLLPHPARTEEPAQPGRGKSTDRSEGNEDGNSRGPKDRASRKRTM
jgi:type II secretory pathway predicted ATPase ExeA